MIKKVDKKCFNKACHSLCFTCENGYAGKCSFIDVEPATDEIIAAEIERIGIVALCWKPSNHREEKRGRKINCLFKVIECPDYIV